MSKNKVSEKIVVKTGKYPRVGLGINFQIGDIQFFSTTYKAKTGLVKKILKLAYYDKDQDKRITSTLSGLKPVSGSKENNEYYFDLNHPSYRKQIEADALYYKLRVLDTEIEVVKDLG